MFPGRRPKMVGTCIMTRDGGIGVGNCLPFYDTDYLKRFKAMFRDKTLIIGGDSYRRLSHAGVAGCNLVVLSRTMGEEECPFATVIRSPADIDSVPILGNEIIVGGGRSTYEAFLPRMDAMHITVMRFYRKKSSVYFPGFFPEPFTMFGEFGRRFTLARSESFERRDSFDYDILTFRRRRFL